MYYDKNNNKIEAGMILVDDSDGEEREVLSCGEEDENGEFDLGFDATNHNWSLGVAPAVCYPLSSFDLSEWRIK